MNNRFCVLIPAYKPTDDLLKLINQIETQIGCSIIVVDDGSGEEYDSLFESAMAVHRCHVIRYAQNKGKGHALKTGLDFCLSEYGDTIDGVVTADADGQHLLKDITKVGEAISENKGKLIMGVRSFNSNTPFRSRFGNHITINVYRLVSGIKLSDTQTGLRGIPIDYVSKMTALEGERYEYEMNMLLALKDFKMGIYEIPIDTVYIDNNSSSHFDTIKDSARIYRLIIKKSSAVKYIFSSLASFVIDWAVYSIILTISGVTVFTSQAIARAISSVFNFFVNKKIVFENKNNSMKNHLLQGIGYFLLVIFNLIVIARSINHLLINLGINRYISQPIANIIQFLISYSVQKSIVFRKKK